MSNAAPTSTDAPWNVDAELYTLTIEQVQQLNTDALRNDAATVSTSEAVLDPELSRLGGKVAPLGTKPTRLEFAKLYLLGVNNVKFVIANWVVPDAGDEHHYPIAAALEELKVNVALHFTHLEHIMRVPSAPFCPHDMEENLNDILCEYNRLTPYVEGLMAAAGMNPKDKNTCTSKRTLQKSPSDAIVEVDDKEPDAKPDDKPKPTAKTKRARKSSASSAVVEIEP